MQTQKAQSRISIGRGLALITLITSLPILIFLIFSNTYLTARSRAQTISLVRDSLTLYQNMVDAKLKNHDIYLIDFMNSNADVMRMVANPNEDEALLARIRIQNRFIQSTVYYSDVCGFFVFDTLTQKEAFAFIDRFRTESIAMLRTLEKDILAASSKLSFVKWFPYQSQNGCYLIRLVRVGSTCTGTAIRCDELMPSNDGESSYALLDESGNVLSGVPLHLSSSIDAVRRNYAEGTLLDRDVGVIGVASGNGSYILAQAVQLRSLNARMDTLQLLTIIMTIYFLLAAALQQVFHRRSIIMPLNRAADAMRLVRDGNMHVKLPEPPDMLEETHLIYHTFNQMTAEIERLKIDIYEERLKRQRAALQFLQLQNKPHFFSNALQLIKAMAEKGDYARIGHIVDLIAKYMRYSLSGESNVVSLLDELRHAEDYVELVQYSKGTRRVQLDQQVDPHCLHLTIPPLMIQTFLENTMHYGVTEQAEIHFSLTCTLAASQSGNRFIIHMQDNGSGFSPHILALHAAGKPLIDERGEHIGITNITERLHLLFGQDAQICLSNQMGGAHIQIDMTAVEVDEYNARFNR